MKIYQCNTISSELIKAFEDLIPQLSPDSIMPSREYLEQIVQSGNTILIVAEEERITGSLTLVINQMPSGRKAWIEDVVVDKNSRGQGIGKMKTVDIN